MPMVSHSFKRLVLGLHPSAPDRTMQLAIDLAGLLQLDLLGLFLEDTSLRDLAGIPFARELRLLGGGWHPIDVDRLSHEMRVSARSSERLFAEAAKRLSTRCQFEIVQARATQVVELISRTDDIVMIVEPLSPAERVSQQFAWFIDAAFRSAAAVMFVPLRVARTAGPVVAVAAASGDASIRTAAAIALAAKEDLVVVAAGKDTGDDSAIRNLAADTGLTIRRVAAGDPGLRHPIDIAQALDRLQERLIVMTRGVLADEAALSIASSRRVPVLLVEPPDEMGDRRKSQPEAGR